MNEKLAKIITNLGNPFILIIPLAQFILFLNGFYDILSFGLVIGLQVVLPVILMLIFLKLKIITDFEITNPKERTLYFILLSILFFISVFIGNSAQAFVLNISLFVGITLILIINLWWKISGHMLLDAICMMATVFINPLFALILPFFLVVGYTRVLLKKHNYLQVIVGFLVGVLIYLIATGINSYFW